MKERDKPRAYKKIEKAVHKHQDKINEILETYFDELYFTLNSNLESVVDDFYNSYTPKVYNRLYDLYNVLSIEYSPKKLQFYATLGPDNMQFEHRASNEYIYELSFVDGWHGGARSGPPDSANIPFPGSYDQPYYRDGATFFKLWGEPAENAGFSPYETFIELSNQSCSALATKYIGMIRKEGDEYKAELKKIAAQYHIKLDKN